MEGVFMVTFLRKMMIVALMCFWGVGVSANDEVKLSLFPPAINLPYVIKAGSNDLYIVKPNTEFLYYLYSHSKENEEEFIKLVSQNKRKLSIDQCIALLEENKIYMKKVAQYADELYYSSRNLSKGLMLGALAVGGFVAMSKAATWIRDLLNMYNQEQWSGMYVKAGLLETARSSRSKGVMGRIRSFFGYEDGFVTQAEAQEIEKTYKDLGMQPSAHKSYKDLLIDAFNKYNKVQSFATDQTEKALHDAGLEAYRSPSAMEKSKQIRYVLPALGLGATIYGQASQALINYVDGFYKLYQKNKADSEKVLKAMEQGEKMLQILKNATQQ